MKKAASLLLALLIAGSMGTAFASEDNPGTYYADFDDTSRSGAGDSDSGGADENQSRWSMDDDGVISVTIGDNELFLVDDSGRVSGAGVILDPNTQYSFQIYVYQPTVPNELGNTSVENLRVPTGARQLTGADMKIAGEAGKYAKLRLRNTKGDNMISSARINRKDSADDMRFELEVRTGPTTVTSLSDVEFRLDVTDGPPTLPIASSIVGFRVGYQSLDEDYSYVKENGTVTISEGAPVITRSQFGDISESAKNRNVYIEADDGSWRYYGHVGGMRDTNFTYNREPVPSVADSFSHNNLYFLNFPSGVSFPGNGEMHINVSEISSDFADMHTYLYRDGRLTAINAAHDAANDELVFRTNFLGYFVISDSPLTSDQLLYTDLDGGEEIGKSIGDSINNDRTRSATAQNDNPTTGADSTGAMLALGLVTMTAGCILFRKAGRDG